MNEYSQMLTLYFDMDRRLTFIGHGEPFEFEIDLIAAVVGARLQLIERERPEKHVAFIVVHFKALLNVNQEPTYLSLVHAAERAILQGMHGHVERTLPVGQKLVQFGLRFEIQIPALRAAVVG